jgi:hypothetical protein
MWAIVGRSLPQPAAIDQLTTGAARQLVAIINAELLPEITRFALAADEIA